MALIQGEEHVAGVMDPAAGPDGRSPPPSLEVHVHRAKFMTSKNRVERRRFRRSRRGFEPPDSGHVHDPVACHCVKASSQAPLRGALEGNSTPGSCNRGAWRNDRLAFDAQPPMRRQGFLDNVCLPETPAAWSSRC